MMARCRTGQWTVLLLLLGVSVAFAASEVHEASVKEVRSDSTPPDDSENNGGDDKLEELSEDGDTESDSAISILTNLWDNIALLLHSPERQWLQALTAFIFGVPLLTNSVASFDLIIIVAHFLLACALTQSEVSSIWHVHHTQALALFMGIQVAVLCASATYKGIDGVRIFYVALLGGALAMALQAPLAFVGIHQLEDGKWAMAVYYSFFCWIALGMYKMNLLRPILAVIVCFCSLLGGALITSAVAWAAAFCCLKWVHPGDFHIVGGDWVDFLLLLFTPGSRDLGVFAGSSSSNGVDIIVDRIVWLLLASGGISFQLERMKLAAGGPATSNEGLRQKLLVAAV